MPARTLHIEMAEPFKERLPRAVHGNRRPQRGRAWRDRYVLSPAPTCPRLTRDEVYLHDLVGLRVEDQGGEVVGKVLAYYELPHDVDDRGRAPRADTVMIPYRFVTEVDLEAKRLVVEPPDGLL